MLLQPKGSFTPAPFGNLLIWFRSGTTLETITANAKQKAGGWAKSLQREQPREAASQATWRLRSERTFTKCALANRAGSSGDQFVVAGFAQVIRFNSWNGALTRLMSVIARSALTKFFGHINSSASLRPPQHHTAKGRPPKRRAPSQSGTAFNGSRRDAEAELAKRLNELPKADTLRGTLA